MMFIQ